MTNGTMVETFADRVRLLVRSQDGGNARAASRRIGIPSTTLQHLTSGAIQSPRIPTLRRLVIGYGATVGWLLDGDGEPPACVTEAETLLAKGRRMLDAWAFAVEIQDEQQASPDSVREAKQIRALLAELDRLTALETHVAVMEEGHKLTGDYVREYFGETPT